MFWKLAGDFPGAHWLAIHLRPFHRVLPAELSVLVNLETILSVNVRIDIHGLHPRQVPVQTEEHGCPTTPKVSSPLRKLRQEALRTATRVYFHQP